VSTLRLQIEVEVPGLDGLEDANAQVKALDDSTGKLGATGQGVFQGIGQEVARFGIGLAQAGISAAIDAVGDSINLASDKAEAASKVNVLFGDSADRIAEASEDAATTVGMSSGAYLTSAGNLGNLLTNMDLASGEAADMSVDMLQLAADVGSFNNADPTEVVEAMGAAFRGESEPIRRFGVMLDEATIKAKAMELGLYEGTGALDKQARAVATYELILEQTSAAQGDFARTADGLANSQKIANARIEDALTGLGEKLMPIVGELVPLIADGLTGAIDVASDAFDAIWPIVERLAETIQMLLGVIGEAVDHFHNLHRAIDPNMAAMEDFQTQFIELGREAGLTEEQITEGWAATVEAAKAGAYATGTSMDTIVDGYVATVEAAEVAARGAEVAADRAVANASRWAASADDIAESYASAGDRLPAIALQAAEEANMADALRNRAVNDMPEAGRAIGHAMYATLNAAEVKGRALEAAHAIGAAVPGEIADGMVAKSREVLDAGDRLIDLLENGLTPKQQAMRLIGEKYTKAVAAGIRSEIPGARESALQLAVTSINTVEDAGLTGARGQRGMKAIGEYYDSLLAAGMTAAEARVALAAGGVADATIDRLEGRANGFEGAGDAVAAAWVSGILSRLRSPATQGSINRAITIATRAMHGESPPPVGPLRHIDDWGANVAAAWGEGFSDGLGRITPLLSGFNPLVDATPGMSSSSPSSAGALTVNVYTGVGDPVAIGREVVEVIGAYERTSGRAWRT
jgi:hypothetical protein